MVPRGRSEKSIEAEKQYRAGKKLVDIARDMGVPEGTVRRWKSDQDWDGKKKKKQSERSETKTNDKPNARNISPPHTQRNYTSKIQAENPGEEATAGGESETNTRSPFARPGNRNAVGNKGGPGGPLRNKHAVKTHEYETFWNEGRTEEELNFLAQDDVFDDEYFQQRQLLKDLSLRERTIRLEIEALERTPGGMVIETSTKIKADETMSYTNRDAEGVERPGTDIKTIRDNSTHVARSVAKRIAELRAALDRVVTRKQTAITQLRRMKENDIKLMAELEKLRIYKQRIAGKIDLDELIDDDLDDDL